MQKVWLPYTSWLSVIVKLRIVVNCLWEDTFGSLLEMLDVTDVTIEKVQIASNGKFTDPVHVVPLDAPIIVCDQFKCMHECPLLKGSQMHLKY